MIRRRRSKLIISVILLFAASSSVAAFAFFSEEEAVLNWEGTTKKVILNDNGLVFSLETKAGDVREFLKDKNISTSEYDKIIPTPDAKIFPGASLEIKRAAKIKIQVDGESVEKYVFGKDVREALRESQVSLGRLDKTVPELDMPAENGLKIIVTRINVEEIVEKEEIPFEISAKKDKELGWREKKIESEGKNGIKEVRYRITYKDGREVSRVKLETNIMEEPVTQVEVQGTYMKLGKAAKGIGTWYAWKGGLYAASTTLPKGSFAKVTNVANGKTVVVEINDYGPQGKGRIIDLDKVAFAKIASVGAGVIGVKVEPVLN